MARAYNTVGGGAQTNVNGLEFEARTHLIDALENHPDFEVDGNRIFKNEVEIANYYEKHRLYNELLSLRGVDYRTIISKKLLPDGALLVGNTIYIIEKKFQNGGGSVDEKLQTCDFKKKQYKKLFTPLGIEVEFYYVLNDWFQQECYRDVFEYIRSVGCDYFFEELPLNRIGLE
ncbi:hypothetical protein [Empedobacter brevis]|uniref:hypothetical protein n=1 Tax=Empedobacter brevis TaxID=247 RepID=UPI0028A0277C|nr:hypothetical protein [Empedobacter brevis]